MKTYFFSLFSFLLLFCSNNSTETNSVTKENIQKHPEFGSYWYQGKAEVTSYELLQNRYGEIRKGTAVTIFVSEDFLPEKQVKADYQNKNNIPVLKLNATKKFVTGIYPYSLMTSTFTPIQPNENAIKISFSSQEWCGNTYVQMNNRTNYDINFYSYFESNTDKKISLEKVVLENDFWNQLRINPKEIKTGNYPVIPAFEYLALNHKEIKSYTATVSLTESEGLLRFKINYSKLNRTLSIALNKEFPFTIESWEETITKNGKDFTTSAKKIKTILSPYWNEKGENGLKLRKELGL